MNTELANALIALLGTAIGTFGGIIASSRLTTYRLEQLEKKVDKHNSVIDRMYKAESRLDVIENKIAVADHRIEDIERKEE